MASLFKKSLFLSFGKWAELDCLAAIREWLRVGDFSFTLQ
jgi:hypothetical protein